MKWEKTMEIRRYSKEYEASLFDMLVDEGDDWKDYHGPAGRSNYIKALESSITYIACEGNLVCGYVRCREDDGFGVYVYDLLVRKEYRGKQIGKSLMERVCQDFPDQPVYVMSDVDPYYEKLGYRREGSIFEVQIKKDSCF
jgi:ribosomal protein S18 acetylase RimI-like enzyme